AIEAAKKDLIEVPLVDGTVPHEIIGRFSSGRVFMKPAAPGTGVIAGGPVRAVLELAGVTDILSKSLGATTPMNDVRSTITGFTELKRAEEVVEFSIKSIEDLQN